MLVRPSVNRYNWRYAGYTHPNLAFALTTVAKIPVKKREIEFSRLTMLGLAGVCLICVTQILTLSTRDFPLVLALGSFSIALPALTAAGIMFEELIDESFVDLQSNLIATVAGILGFIGVFLGLVSVFWHFHWVIGVLFLVSSSASLVGTLCFWSRLNKS